MPKLIRAMWRQLPSTLYNPTLCLIACRKGHARILRHVYKVVCYFCLAKCGGYDNKKVITEVSLIQVFDSALTDVTFSLNSYYLLSHFWSVSQLYS